METRAHHVLIGAFTLGVAALALLFVLWMSKHSADRAFTFYDVVFNESVSGLSKGGMVQYNGITVGEVSDLKLAPHDPSQVVARMRVTGGTPIKTDTTAILALTGVTGVAFIQLSGGTQDAPRLEPAPGQDVAVIVAQTSALSKILASGGDIMLNLNQTLLRAGELLSEQNIQSIGTMIGNLDRVVGSVADQRESLSDALKQLSTASRQLNLTLQQVDTLARSTNTMIGNGNNLLKQADGLIGNANTLVQKDARESMQALQKALDGVNQMVRNADGMIGDNRASLQNFTGHGLRQIGPALDELRSTVSSLQQLIDQVSQSNSPILGNALPKEYQSK